MDYFKIYDNLIGRARTRILEGYKESHHIIPRCMDGKDTDDNLVNLTAEEHFIAHQLLVKMYPDNPKLAFAAMMMTRFNKSNTNRSMNKEYSWLRKRRGKLVSDMQKGKKRLPRPKYPPTKDPYIRAMEHLEAHRIRKILVYY